MASDLISRDALLDSLEEAYKELKKICDSLRYEDEKRICNAQLSTFAELTMRVRKAPTVDAEPVRHGETSNRTIWHTSGWGTIYTSYSCCGFQVQGKTHHNYCPNCGVKIDGGKT